MNISKILTELKLIPKPEKQKEWDNSLKKANEYTDTQIKNIGSMSKNFIISTWEVDNTTGLYKSMLTHNLNSTDVFVHGYNTNTMQNEIISCKIVDLNNIEFYSSNQDSITVKIINMIPKSISINDVNDSNIIITDSNNNFKGSTLDVVLDELKNDLGSISTDAKGTSYDDSTTSIGATNLQQVIEILISKYKDIEARQSNIESEVNGRVTAMHQINLELEREIGLP